MPVSPRYPDVRDCDADIMRLASAVQRHSPVFSSAVKAADPSCAPDSAHPTCREQNGRSDKTSPQDAHLQKSGGQKCHEEEEETEDEDDDFAALSLDEACSAVYDAAAGRSLPQQARDVLVPPSSHSPLPTTTSKACDKLTAAGAGTGASGGDGGQWVEQQNAAGGPRAWTEGAVKQDSSTPRSSSSVSFATSSSNNVGDTSNGNSASNDVQGFHSPVRKRGGSDEYSLRRLLWLRLLGVLQGADPFSWARQLQQHREAYVRLQEEEERQLSAKRLTMLDPQRFHPLAATADNPWSQRQQNEALLMEIWKDVERTLAERRLFRSESTRKSLQRILFTWSRRNPEVSYKQGMNELLAIFYLVCYREKVQVPSSHGDSKNKISSSGRSKPSSSFTTSTNSECRNSGATNIGTSAVDSDYDRKRETDAAVAGAGCGAGKDQLQYVVAREEAVQVLLSADPAAVEADAFALFEAVMNCFMVKAAYLPAPSAPTAAGGGMSLLHKGSSGGSRFVDSVAGFAGGLPPLIARRSMTTASKSALLWRCNYLFETLLPFADRPLYEHLKSEEVEPQLFLLRWIRLLFSREFHIEDTLLLWDALFADAYLHAAIEKGGQTPSYQASGSLQHSGFPASCCDETNPAAHAAKGGLQLQEQQQQQQRRVSMNHSNGICALDPFKLLLRHSTAPAGTSAVELMYDPAQVGMAAAAKLPLVDYFVLAMLKYVRATLLESNQIFCLRRLLRFPPTESIQPLVLLAVSLRTRRLPQPGRSMKTAASRQQILSSPLDCQAPPFPSICCTQSQPQQQLQQQIHQEQQQVQQEQQQKEHEQQHERVAGEPGAAGVEQKQQHSLICNEQHASAQSRTEEKFFHCSPAAATAPAGVAAAIARENCAEPSLPMKTTSTLHFREDLLSVARPCMTASPLLGFADAALATAGVEVDRPALAASAPADSTEDLTRVSSSGRIDNPGRRNQRCRPSPIVQVDIRPAAAGDCCGSATAEAAGLNMSSSSSSSSFWVREQRESDTSAAENDSTIVAGRTISRHVEEVAADIRAALALWSSWELLSRRSSSRREIMKGAGSREEEAQERTFIPSTQRMQAAEERIAAALVRLQLLQRVLDGDIAYNSSLFPPAAGSSLCAGAVSAAGETAGASVNKSRSKYTVEGVGGDEGAAA